MVSRLHCVGVDTLIMASWWSRTRLGGYFFAICYILLRLLMLSIFFCLRDGALRQEAGIEDG